MKVLVDTPIWSLAFRRKKADLSVQQKLLVAELTEMIREYRAVMIGPVRQEILSGIASTPQFEQLKQRLRAFKDLKLTSDDYAQAAAFYNHCRQKGIQGSQIDFLLCAVANRYHMPIFTTDGDFELYARHIDINLHHMQVQ
jgi:predicted nucleic acid-binding protein